MIIRKEKQSCTGCSACMNICPKDCISMVPDKEGFKYPFIDISRCINCGMCEKVCPILHIKKESISEIPKAFLTWSTEQDINSIATSGGLVSSIARDVLSEGGYIVGAVYSDCPSEGVYHTVIDSMDDLSRFSRSKYVQSDVNYTFKQVGELLSGSLKPLLFVGTACQVYGLKSYLNKKYGGKHFANLITIDVVCHGVPSPLLFKKYVLYLEDKFDAEVKRVEMRHKKKVGGFFSEAQTNVFFANGQIYSEDAGIDLFGRCFWGEICSRPSCYSCPFKTIGRISDITVGDCWFSRSLSGNKNIPYDVTLAFAQSVKGIKLIQKCKNLEKHEVNCELAIKVNGGMMYKSAVPHPKRKEFFEKLDDVPLEFLVEQLLPDSKIKNDKGIVLLLKNSIKKIPGLYKTYYFKCKDKEFQARCRKKIKDEAICKCIIE